MWVTEEIDQMFALSDLRSPDIGRGRREKPNDWRGPQTEVGFFPLSGSKGQKSQFLSKARGRQTIAILLRAEDKKINWDMRDPSPSSQY